MKRIFAFGLIVLIAGLASCSDSGGPASPSHTARHAVSAVQNECGEEDFISALDPVLHAWRDSIHQCFNGEFLVEPPVLGAETSVEDYVSELDMVLGQWHVGLTDSLGEGVLDSPPPYDEGDHIASYLANLSPVLQQWHGALGEACGVLPEPPVFAEDETPPEIVCPADTTIACADSSGAVLDYVVDVFDGCDPNPKVVCDPPSGSTFPLGETMVTCTAMDSSGNSADCSFTVNVEAALPPMITCPPDTAVECTSFHGATVEFEAIATSECDDNVDVECTPPSGTTFVLGETVVKCVATDSFGNSAECEFKVLVDDGNPPEITCPADTIVECTGDGGAVVVFEAVATDVCDPNPTVECTPPSGSHFPVGETVVMCVATDGAGNSSSCSFTVTVEDTQPPVIHSVSVDRTELWAPNHDFVDVYVTVDVEDVCDAIIDCAVYDVTSDEPIDGIGDGSTQPDWQIVDNLQVRLRAERAGPSDGRTYTLHVRCVDDSGNAAEGTVTVTVPHDQGKND